MGKKHICKDLSEEYTNMLNSVSAPVMALIETVARSWAHKVMVEGGKNLAYAVHAYERFYFDIVTDLLNWVNKERWNVMLELIKEYNIDVPEEYLRKVQEYAREAAQSKHDEKENSQESEDDSQESSFMGENHKRMYI